MIKKLRKEYHQASQWAHHHSAVLVLGLTLFAAVFAWNFGGVIQPQENTHAQSAQADRCDTNSGAISIPHTECLGLAQIYVDTDGDNRSIPERGGDAWFSGTNVSNREGIYVQDNHIYGLNFSSLAISTLSTLNFSAFPELQTLNLQYATVGGLDISANTVLQYLYLDSISGISTIDVSNNTNLVSLNWNVWGDGSTLMSTPNLSNNTSLEYLNLQGHGLSSIDISNNLSLRYLGFGDNNLSSIDVSMHTNLEELQIQNNNISSLDVSNNPNLYVLTMSNNSVSTLDLSNNTNMNRLTALNNGMTDLILPTTNTLMYMRVQQNAFTSIDVSVLSGLQVLYVNDNNLTSFDPGVNNIDTLTELDLSNNQIDTLGPNFINLSVLMGGMQDNLNGNCLSITDPILINFLDENFADRSANQTCGVQPPICERVTDIPQSECETLVELYNATDGDNWYDNTNWLQTEQVCGSWFGVRCDYKDKVHVNDISLQNNSLSGTIPSLIGLPYLEQIWIDSWIGNGNDNNIDLDLSSFAGLSNLANVSAYNMQSITGSVSSLHDSALTLDHLQLSDPQTPFEIDVTDLSVFTNMIELYATNNVVYGDFSTLSSLTNIERLWLSCRDGTEDFCGGTGGMSFVLSMPNIKELAIDNLRVGGQLPDMSGLTQLEKLNIRENELSGVLFDVSGLTNLIEFNIGGNNITGTLPSFSNSANLEVIGLNGTLLGGEIPTSWSNLTQLRDIRIGGNGGGSRNIYGDLPASRSNLTNLETIEVLFTRINGPLPASWSQLNNLTFLAVFFNDIVSEIPEERSAFTDGRVMERFWLNNNHLYGDLPTWIGDLQTPISIGNNCIDIDPLTLSADIQNVLNMNGNSRQNQSNCLSNIVINKSTNPAVVNPGDTFQMIIDYANIGQQKAANFELSEAANEYLTFNSREPEGTQAIVNKTYFNSGDQCFLDLMYGNSGPYHAHMANALGQFFDTSDGYPTGGTPTEILDFVWTDFTTSNMGGSFSPSEFGQYINSPDLSTGGALTLILCAAVEGNMDFDPVYFEELSHNVGGVCMQPFGLDKRLYRDQGCGAGGVDGYRWSMGDILPGSTGRIILTFTLDQGISLGTEIQNTTFIDLDGENEGDDDNTESFSIVVGQESGGGDQGGENPGPSQGNGGSSGGGSSSNGGSMSLRVDDCSGYTPPVDKSSSYYDAKCEEETKKHPSAQNKKFLPTEQEIQAQIAKLPAGSKVDPEEIEAYLMAKNIGMTTANSFSLFNAEDELTRAQAAKFFVEYIEEVLGKEANEERRAACSKFDDIAKLKGQDLHEFVIRACMHKIMGLDRGVAELQSFRPYDILPRSESSTIISRILYGTTYDNTQGKYSTWYAGHMNKLMEDKLITVPEPTIIEKRIYPLLMFLRWIKAQ